MTAPMFPPLRRGGAMPHGLEQPRCKGCGHRRIFHVLGTGGAKPYREEPRPCSARTKAGVMWDYCGCDNYEPDEWTAA